MSRGEDLINTSEVHKVKRMLSEKEREERRNNIVIKGIDKIEDIKDTKEWTEKLLREELDVKGKVIQCRRSNKVLIAKLGKDEEKKEVMFKKNKLKGSKIYIENDLTWEERKIQDKIKEWARQRRMKGEQVKIGIGKVWTERGWRYWNEIEKEEGRQDFA